MTQDVYSQLSRRIVESRDRTEVDRIEAEVERQYDLGHLSNGELAKLFSALGYRRLYLTSEEAADA